MCSVWQNLQFSTSSNRTTLIKTKPSKKCKNMIKMRENKNQYLISGNELTTLVWFFIYYATLSSIA